MHGIVKLPKKRTAIGKDTLKERVDRKHADQRKDRAQSLHAPEDNQIQIGLYQYSIHKPRDYGVLCTENAL